MTVETQAPQSVSTRCIWATQGNLSSELRETGEGQNQEVQQETKHRDHWQRRLNQKQTQRVINKDNNPCDTHQNNRRMIRKE